MVICMGLNGDMYLQYIYIYIVAITDNHGNVMGISWQWSWYICGI